MDTVLFKTPELKIRNDNGQHKKHPSVGMFSPFQPKGMHMELYGILDMLRHLSMYIEHLRTNIRCSK